MIGNSDGEKWAMASTNPDYSSWTSANLRDRLSLLATLVAEWRSPPAHTHSSEVTIPSFAPQTLKWFYELVSSYSDTAFQRSFSGWTDGTPIVDYHWLRRAEALAVDGSGILEFLNETQGVYQCGVRVNDVDPNVFMRAAGESEWVLQADRLTDFLFVLLTCEFSINTDHFAWGTQVQIETLSSLTRLDFPSVTWQQQGSVFAFHGDGLIMLAVRNLDGSTGLQAGAKTQNQLEVVRNLQGWEGGFDAA